ncbi:MAG TPA: polyphosphate kinase 1 [Gammaproteobacteria bacterium]|nr:polyphosphate kinase 1 [Gammaproteobacteria bacterium]
MRVETSEERPGISPFETDGSVPLIDRDLSDLAFVERVLEEAENTANPVLERARFLAITGMLLDEFYRIRVAFLREQIRLHKRKRGRHEPKPSNRLKRADKYSNRLIRRQDRCWRDLLDDLKRAGVDLVAAGEASDEDREWLAGRFDEQILPRLAPDLTQTPDAFASIRDGDLLLFAELEVSSDPLDDIQAFVPIPADLPRFFALPGPGCRFMPIEEVIKLFLNDLFDDARVAASGLARVLREGSLKRSGVGDDLLTLVRDAVERRERANVIRLRVERSMPQPLMRALAAGLGLLRPEEIKALEKSRRRATASEFVVADAFLGLADLIQLVELLPTEIAERHSFPRHCPKGPEFVTRFRGDLFRAIAAKDRMLHFPYDDFDVLVTLIRMAAADDAVVAIRQTLYRTGKDALIVQALAAAARSGKTVDVVVEVQAREDEKRNIELAAFLGSAGANVSYGFLERKVHAKLLVIERREKGAVRRYVHCSTGNYSISSGHSYTDLSLLSADPELADDADQVFAYVHGGAAPQRLAKISAAPFGLRERIAGLIERETRNAENGEPAAIWMKLNRLSDEQMIRLLYRASQAGVDIEIIVRGICCLRPGVPGLSERIRVKSVVGRFLEHSRALCFGNGHALPSRSADVFISSADLMSHKLDVRVEMLVRIDDDELKRQIQYDVFAPYLDDQASSWLLGADDKWIRQSTSGYCAQQALATGTPER